MKLNDLTPAAPLPPGNLPRQDVSEDVLLEKYAKGDESSLEDVRRRAQAGAHYLRTGTWLHG